MNSFLSLLADRLVGFGGTFGANSAGNSPNAGGTPLTVKGYAPEKFRHPRLVRPTLHSIGRPMPAASLSNAASASGRPGTATGPQHLAMQQSEAMTDQLGHMVTPPVSITE